MIFMPNILLFQQYLEKVYANLLFLSRLTNCKTSFEKINIIKKIVYVKSNIFHEYRDIVKNKDDPEIEFRFINIKKHNLQKKALFCS